MSSLPRALILLLAGLVVAACSSGSDGSGNVVTDQRDVAAFRAVVAQAGITVVVSTGPGRAREVEVTYDDNLQEYVTTEVREDTLYVGFDGDVRVSGGGRSVEVTAPLLERMEATDGSRLEADGVAEQMSLSADGGSALDASELAVGQLAIRADGGASVKGTAIGALDVTADGGAAVVVAGTPSEVDVVADGGAAISLEIESGSLIATATGGSAVDIYGSPDKISFSEEGDARITIHP